MIHLLTVKRTAVLFITLLTLFFYLFLPTNTAFGESLDESEKKLQEIQKQISDLENQLGAARNQEKTLKSQLQFIDSQTKLTQLKIEETNAQITKLEKEISDLSLRIDRLSTSLDVISQLLLNRIAQTYKYGNVTFVDLFFSSTGFADLLERLKYIQVVQAHDKKILYQLQATKTTYKDQKTDRELRQAQQEKLSKDLQQYQKQLGEQKKAKDELLRVTKNDEAKFQGLIAQLRAEIASIAQAISNVGPVIGPVSKSQTIAAMGSTGCSTGPHLHFEVFENAKVEGGKVIGNRVNPHNYLDGKLGPPLQGYPGETTITTEYGASGLDYIPGWPPHTGLDIAPKKYEGVGRAILASEKGISYSVSAPCSYNITGGSAVGKGVVIDHENGIVTLYWHIL